MGLGRCTRAYRYASVGGIRLKHDLAVVVVKGDNSTWFGGEDRAQVTQAVGSVERSQGDGNENASMKSRCYCDCFVLFVWQLAKHDVLV